MGLKEWGTGPSAKFVPLFDEYIVQIAFENHVHAFKRTVPMQDHQANANGTIYLGDGRAGVSGLGVPSSKQVLPRSADNRLAVDSQARNHMWKLNLGPQYYDVKAIDTGGVVFDNCTIAASSIHSVNQVAHREGTPMWA